MPKPAIKARSKNRAKSLKRTGRAQPADLVKQRRRHIDQRLQSLYQRVSVLEKELQKLEDPRFYRCCIFGSARIKPDDKIYKEVFTLARYLAWEGIDVLTGGGPGLMEAANKGAKLGQEERHTKSISIGLPIELDFEPTPNQHLDVKRHHKKFSSRLDDFMRLSHSIIVTPGGIGTLLELYFSWQLIQVHHLPMRPIVLLERQFWSPLVDWMRSIPLARKLVSPQDFEFVQIAPTPEKAYEIISEHHRKLAKEKAAAAKQLPLLGKT